MAPCTCSLEINEMTSYDTVALPNKTSELSRTALLQMRDPSIIGQSTYGSLLRGPTSVLVSVVHERADVAFAAILGYN
jgi:hypothetical protein